MRRFFALLHARNLEFMRDRSSYGWALLFPLLAILGCAVAFSSDREQLFEVGVVGDPAAYRAELPFLAEPWVRLSQVEDLQRAEQQVRQHQLHLLLAADVAHYWINPQSSRGQVLERLLLASPGHWQAQPVQGQRVRYVDWVVPGVLGMNLMFSALFGVGYMIVRYRQNGVLKRLHATPVTAFEFILAQMASRFFISLLTTAAVFAGCLWLLDLQVAGHYLDLLAVAACGTLAMLAVGLVIASRTQAEEAANGMINLVAWPMMFLSEVWFSLDSAAPWMQQLANWLPLTHLVRASREVMINGAGLVAVAHHLAYLGGLALVLVGIAGAGFRWGR